ncbi:MAG: hypothetical protein H8D46_04935 [FCB group bacterium]|nr:hypothetical protein [FCB group bacterium]
MAHKEVKEFGSIEEILQHAMEDEKDASRYYLEASKRTPDPDLQKFLLKLAEMEVDHYNSLKAKLEECRAQDFCAQAILSSFHEKI